MKRILRLVALLTGVNLLGLYCEAQERTKLPRYALPEALFSPFARTLDNFALKDRALVEGPVLQSEARDNQDGTTIIVRCATQGGSGRGDVQPGNYLAFVQPFYIPFETETLFRRYASEAAFYHMIGPPLSRETKEVKCCPVSITSAGIDQVTINAPSAAKHLFSKNRWVRIIHSFSIYDSQRETYPKVADVTIANENNDLQTAELKLERIGTAIIRYLGVHGHFPPHVVRGPNGEPWHSWRVLILPFLGAEEHELYRQYDLTRPWDSEKNLAVLARMPVVYRDPASRAVDDTHTHFAAVLGEKTVFSRGDCTLPNEFRINTFSQPAHYLQFPPNNARVMLARSVTDGQSNTILVGTVAVERKIPWTEPTDITLNEQSTIGEPGGFGARYDVRGEPLALFLFANGRVDRIPRNLPSDVLWKLATANGDDHITTSELPPWVSSRKSEEYTGYTARYQWFLQFQTSGGRPTAVVSREPQ